MASECSGSGFGQKVRLNVVALLGESTAAKLLVCIDEDSSIEDLTSKIRNSLARSCIEGTVVRLMNDQQAVLPCDERVGDVLRDAEEVIAVMTRQPQDETVRRQLQGGVGNIMNFARADGAVEDDNAPFYAVEPSDDEEDDRNPEPVRYKAPCPGPSEAFEDDLKEPLSKSQNQLACTLPAPSCDWSVENLTPKLREFISTRFKEAHIVGAGELGHNFISVTMRPHARVGAAPPTVPIHYSIARVDVIEFERLSVRSLEETRNRMDYFQRCRQALTSLVDQGARESELTSNMLPYKYRQDGEFEGLLSETDSQTFGQVEGFRPMVLVDTSGAVGHSLVYIKQALKRMMYSFMVAKSKFNLVKFSSQGRATQWAAEMVPPTAQVLREAEEWLEAMKKTPGQPNFLDGIRLCVAPPDADSIFVLTSSFPKRCDVDYTLRTIRQMNIRDLPVHVIGVDCEPKAELELRRLAEENHGSFRQKRFDGISTVQSAVPSRTAWRPGQGGGSGGGSEKLSIGGQLSILEVMVDEQQRQKIDWLEEQKCANRLLLTTATQQPVLDADALRARQRRAVMAEAASDLGTRPRMQDLIEAGGDAGRLPPARLPPPRPSSARRSLGGSQGQTGAPSRGSVALAETMKRPSIANPWDRPGATIRVSQLAAASQVGRSSSARPVGRSSSVRGRSPSLGNRTSLKTMSAVR